MPREQNSDREGISVGDFVRLLWAQYSELTGAGREGDLAGNLDALLDDGKRRGWLEAQDILESGKPLLRRQAARILHEFIRKECRETDEEDWGAARELADLYDCRVCANHVAQVYVKGIMEARSERKPGKAAGEESQERSNGELQVKKDPVKYFGMEERVLPLEAGRITARALDRSRRQPAPPSFEREGEPGGTRITLEEAHRLRRNDSACVLWDVRSREEFEREHLQGAVNVPMMEILDAPEKWADIPKRGVILGCDGGYRSQVAADCLARAGCMNVYYLGWDS